MKKKIAFIVFIVFISISCYAQSSNNNEQRLIGTWTNLLNNRTLIINSNGTVSGDGWKNTVDHWAAAGDTLVLWKIYSDGSGSVDSNRFQFSSDGKTLIIGGTPYRKN